MPHTNYDFSDQIGHLLRRAYQKHTAHFQKSIPDSQLTAVQFVALCSIRDNDACSLTDIVKLTVIDQATIRGVIDRLKQRDLVVIEHDQKDKRKIVIKLTDQGAELIKSMEPYALEITENTYGNLNPGERIALHFLLKKIIGTE